MSRAWFKFARFTKILLAILVVFIFAGGILSLAINQSRTGASGGATGEWGEEKTSGTGVTGEWTEEGEEATETPAETAAGFETFSAYIRTALEFGWVLAMALAVLMIILGGYSYMISGGGQGAVVGKEMIWYALAGLALLFLAGVLGITGAGFPGESGILGNALKLLQGG